MEISKLSPLGGPQTNFLSTYAGKSSIIDVKIDELLARSDWLDGLIGYLLDLISDICHSDNVSHFIQYSGINCERRYHVSCQRYHDNRTDYGFS